MFNSRLELIAYFISSLTGTPLERCRENASLYLDKPFVLRWTLDQ